MGMRLVSCLIALVLAGSASAELVGYWQLDEGTGTTAKDSSGNGNIGTFVGALQWVDGYDGGALKFNGVDTYVEIPDSDSLAATSQVTVAAWTNWTDSGDAWLCILANGQQNGPWENYGLFVNRGSRFAYFTLSLNDTHTPNQAPNNTVTPGEWQHISGTWDGSTVRIYVNGELKFEAAKTGTLTSPRLPLRLGHRNGSPHFFSGMMDEVAVFNNALSQAEIQEAMLGLSPAELADSPRPEDAATDVHRDTTLGWAPGQFAATHDVYLGTTFADVNDASRNDPRGVLVSQDQTETEFAPAGLDYGQIYYWRIDEINAAPDYTIFKGQTWSFTVEPYTYPLTAVTATASSSQANMGPENTINGSGLNDLDQHSVVLAHTWMTTGGLPSWIQYEFDKVYKLDELWVWNSNQMIEPFLGFGAKDVAIEYSADGQTWATLEGVPQFAKATGTATYTHNTTVDFGGVMAKFVKLTVKSNWGGAVPQTGLSEVRFFYVPVQAFEPVPSDAATAVSIDTNLSWRPGREAASHKVYIGTDGDAVAEGAVTAAATIEHDYTPASLDFAMTYFWKVDETGEAGTYAGDLWSFTTQEFAPIDDFEAYNDDVDAETTIWHAWIDGLTNEASGSQVGYDQSPFAETTIVHGGKQAMPMMYDNSKSPYYSEAERTFDTPQNFTGNGAESLRVYYRGLSPAFQETASGDVLMNGIGVDIWGTADQFRFAYKNLTGNGSMVVRVNSLHNSNAWAKAGVMIRANTDPGSVHAFMALTPGGAGGGNGASFQRRLTVDGTSASTDSTVLISAPYWVKLDRTGDKFSAYLSPDGVTWTQLGESLTITMPNAALIGLALCSHDAVIVTGAEFSDVATTGGVTGAWQMAEIGVAQPAGNSAEPVYVTVKDSSGKSKTVMSSESAASARMSWQEWVIPLSEFTGVKMTAVDSIVIGVGNRTAPAAGGTGTIYVDDLGYGRSSQ
ncbi:MAG: LamG-like jellyroll fold domain-containing protein [Solirubrobacterales bacterium]